MSKFKVGDKVRLADDVDNDFFLYGVEVGMVGTVNEITEGDSWGMDIGVTLDTTEEVELLFRDFELEAI